MLDGSFFDRDTVEVARALLGQRLVRQLPDGARIESVVTETEAYDGFEDRASHAHRGETPRNAVMFGPPGHVYVYLCYGVHWLLNITTREPGYPAAVLLRGTMAVTGPGRLTRHFRLDGAQNRQPLGVEAGLWLEAGAAPPADAVVAGPRMGVAYAGPEWAEKPWRFCWERAGCVGRG
jgi:DNA-3-methyladenine glycosylase